MAKFKINLATRIARIPNHPDAFRAGEEYETGDPNEIDELRKRPDYVAEEILAEGEIPEEITEVPEEPEEEPDQLAEALAERATRDQLFGMTVNDLKEQLFPDGTKYETVWKYGMAKVQFVEAILEKLED